MTKLKREEAELRKVAATSKQLKADAKKGNAAAAKGKKSGAVAAASSGSAPRGSQFMAVTTADLKSFKTPELTKELQATGNLSTPPHRHEVHVKKEKMTVIVTLHHVPPQKINIDATTDARLVVATPGHTKHYHLDYPFPHGMRVDSAKGEYTFENGELKCEFAVTKMPVECAREWNERLESIRKAQKARFEVTKEGDLVVRRRKTTMELNEIAAKKKAAPQKPNNKAAAPAKEEKEAPAAAAAPGAPSVPKTKKFVDDNAAKLVAMAAASVKKVTQSAKERLQLARATHERRATRAATSAVKKEVKSERMGDAFARVLAEKRKELEMMQKRTAAAKAPAVARGDGKAVSFK